MPSLPFQFTQSQKYLKFSWNNQLYQYTCLPFSLTSAPRLFTKLLKPLIAHLCKQAHTVVFYLDDGWQSGPTYNQCLDTCIATYNLISCGFLPNFSKSHLTPSTHIEILGFVLDSKSYTLSLSNNKTKDCRAVITQCLSDPHALTIQYLSKTISKLTTLFPVLPYSHLHYRKLEHAKLQALHLSHWDWNSHSSIDAHAQEELLWWLHNTDHACCSLDSHPISAKLYADACSYGWGTVLNGKTTHVFFSPQEKPLSINTKEILAVWYALHSFKASLATKHVLVLLDNTTATAYICDKGGMHS